MIGIGRMLKVKFCLIALLLIIALVFCEQKTHFLCMVLIDLFLFLTIFSSFIDVINCSAKKIANKLKLFFLVQYLALFEFLLGCFFIPDSLDSLKMISRCFFYIYFCCSFYIISPMKVKKIFLLLALAFYYLGIIINSFPGLSENTLSYRVQWFVYYKIHELLNLNDKYHYFSPSPPRYSPLLLFKVQYKDNSIKWVTCPNKKTIPLLYERERSFAVHFCNSFMFKQFDADLKEDFYLERIKTNFVDNEFLSIGGADDRLSNISKLFLEPSQKTNLLIQSITRHIYSIAKKEIEISSITFYIILHKVLKPIELQEGKRHNDRCMYFPFYLGDFSSSGNLISEQTSLIGFCLPILKKYDDETDNFIEIDVFFLHSGFSLVHELNPT